MAQLEIRCRVPGWRKVGVGALGTKVGASKQGWGSRNLATRVGEGGLWTRVREGAMQHPKMEQETYI